MQTQNLIPTREAASILGMDMETLMAWLRQKDSSGRPICPFGIYIKREDATRGCYKVYRERLSAYLTAQDMKPADQCASA